MKRDDILAWVKRLLGERSQVQADQLDHLVSSSLDLLAAARLIDKHDKRGWYYVTNRGAKLYDLLGDRINHDVLWAFADMRRAVLEDPTLKLRRSVTKVVGNSQAVALAMQEFPEDTVDIYWKPIPDAEEEDNTMALTYPRIRGTILHAVISIGVIPKDDVRKIIGKEMGLPSIIEQSEARLSDKPDMDFVSAVSAALNDLYVAGVVDLDKEERRTFVRANEHGKELYEQDPYVTNLSLAKCTELVGRNRPSSAVIDAAIMARRAQETDVEAQRRNEIIEILTHMDREMYVTQVIPTLLKKIEYFAGQPKAFFTTPSEEIAGGVPYALLYEDFFDFVTMVRSVPYASKKVTREEISEFVSAMNQSGATRGIFITTSSFDSHTMEYYKDPRVKRRQVAIVNGVDLADLFTLSDYDISEYRTAGE